MSGAFHIQTTVLPGHRIEIVSRDLPEGGTAEVFVIMNSSPGASFLSLPLEERRRLMVAQAEKLAPEYANSAEREDWQGGDILEP